MLRVLPTILCCSSMAMYAASRNSAPWAMLTVRISPKISVKPEATTNIRPAKVSPSSSVITNSPGSRTPRRPTFPWRRTAPNRRRTRSGGPPQWRVADVSKSWAFNPPRGPRPHPLSRLRSTVRRLHDTGQSRSRERAPSLGGGAKELVPASGNVRLDDGGETPRRQSACEGRLRQTPESSVGAESASSHERSSGSS